MDRFDFTKINNRIQEVKNEYEKRGLPTYFTGKFLFSLLFQNNFNYTNKNNVNEKEPIVEIVNGVLISGIINKSQLSGSQKSLIHHLAKEYNVDTSLEFVNNVHFITVAFFDWFGFSISINDCLVKHNKKRLDEIITKGYIEAEEVIKTTKNENIIEAKIIGALSKSKDIGQGLAKDIMRQTKGVIASGPDSNNFVHTVTSGSKGAYFNIAQITTLLGQQNLNGGRVEPQLEGGRTMPHYPFKNLTMEQKYESRGFVKNSFIHGLNPQEFLMHACSGRLGVIDKLINLLSITASVKSVILASLFVY